MDLYSLRSWYACLVAGLLPLLVVGSVASALANHVAFAAWAVVMALLHAMALRRAFSADDTVSAGEGSRRAQTVLLGVWAIAAISWFVLAALLADALGRGARAHVPSWVGFFFDAPWPVTGVLILLGLGFLVFFRVAERR